jgi:ubiquinone biosynthesis protein COQ9
VLKTGDAFMLNELTLNGRIIAAAMRLAAQKQWDDVTMRDIAEAAGSSLVEMRREFPSKGAIIAAFTRAADDAVLLRSARPAADQPARDRIFDVIMTRFDVLAPYKAGIKSIADSHPMDSAVLKKAWASQAWMLHAAGIPTDGPLGSIRVAGLGSVYASVATTWLDDTDPGMARTMAALDRRLKRGEETMRMATGVCDSVNEVFGSLRRVFTRPDKPAEPAAPAAPASPSGL